MYESVIFHFQNMVILLEDDGAAKTVVFLRGSIKNKQQQKKH